MMISKTLLGAFRIGPRKNFNYHLNSLEISRKRERFFSFPPLVTIMTTNWCNSKCPMCTLPKYMSNHDEFSREDMPWDTFLLTRPLWKFAKQILLGSNGEPLLHPRYLDMAEEVKNHRCLVHTFTNGLLLSEAVSERLVKMKFDLIHISFGGGSKDTYRKIRGVDGFDGVLNNLKRLKELKQERGTNKPEVRFNIVAMNSVIKELPELIYLAKSLEVTSIDMFHLRVYFDHIRKESLLLDVPAAQKSFKNAMSLAEKYKVRLSLPTFSPFEKLCLYPLNGFAVRQDGIVVSCPGYRFLLGDITKKHPKEIWNSPQWRSLRRDIWKKGYKQLCPQCAEWCPNNSAILLESSPGGGD